jgi:hypothetical protein
MIKCLPSKHEALSSNPNHTKNSGRYIGEIPREYKQDMVLCFPWCACWWQGFIKWSVNGVNLIPIVNHLFLAYTLFVPSFAIRFSIVPYSFEIFPILAVPQRSVPPPSGNSSGDDDRSGLRVKPSWGWGSIVWQGNW